jgi:SAM-dependent methyltransferase
MMRKGHSMYQVKIDASGGRRSQARVEYHFDVERQLAKRLKAAGRAERRSLYTSVYDELFARVVDHPQFLAILDPLQRNRRIGRQVGYLRSLMGKAGDFVEIGPGDCALAIEMCSHSASVAAVDVSNTITRRSNLPGNFSLVISDGSSIPLGDRTADLVYSDQLMEHLHPEDALTQLQDVHRVLRAGGRYFMITPNAALGPHDVTKYFDYDTPLGLHLKEYSYRELDTLLCTAGFGRRYALIGAAGRYVRVPISWMKWPERLLGLLPRRTRRALIRNKVARPCLNLLLGARVLAIK